VDIGRNYKFHGQIFPFYDRPDVAYPVVWYPVPLDTPALPWGTPFCLRTWDVIEQLPQTLIGTDQSYREIYRGPVPTGRGAAPCGTRAMWERGLSYEAWQAGAYTCNCPVRIPDTWHGLVKVASVPRILFTAGRQIRSTMAMAYAPQSSVSSTLYWQTVCCPNPVPQIMSCTVTGASGAFTSIASPFLVYFNPATLPVPQWIAPISLNGSPAILYVECQFFHWLMGTLPSSPCQAITVISVSALCSSTTLIVFSVTLTGPGPCSGSATFTFSVP